MQSEIRQEVIGNLHLDIEVTTLLDLISNKNPLKLRAHYDQLGSIIQISNINKTKL